MKFQYFTYFLNPLSQGKLFDDKRDKNEVLRDVLMRKEIDVKEGHVAFVPISETKKYIVGRIGKKTTIRKNLPPEEKFAEKFEENWPYCYVVFNTDNNPNFGQRIAFEHKSNVFNSPYDQLKNFSDEVNTLLYSSGWHLSINPITAEKKFWNLVSENENRIKKITFSFNAPNLFNLDNELNEDLKNLQKEYHSTKVTMGLENPDGLLKVPENNLTKQSVDYIAKGGGEYSIQVKGKKTKTYKSKDNVAMKEIEDIDMFLESKDSETILAALGRIFG